MHVVLTNSQANDAILFYSWVAKFPFEYYYRKKRGGDHGYNELVSVWPAPFSDSNRREDLDTYVKYSTNYEDFGGEALEIISKNHDRLWVVLAMDNIEGLGWSGSRAISAIEERYVRNEEFLMKKIKILRYSKIKHD